MVSTLGSTVHHDDKPREPTNHHLLERVASGDRLAFDQLYVLHQARVYGIVVAVVRDHAQAQEVAQEVFLQLWQQASRFDGARGSTSTWIAHVAHARAVDRVRLCQSAAARDADYTRTTPVRDHDIVSEQILCGDEHACVRASLQRLGTLQRESIVLAYYAGMSTAQIGEQLGVNRSTVKTRIRDGLKKLAVDLRVPADTRA